MNANAKAINAHTIANAHAVFPLFIADMPWGQAYVCTARDIDHARRRFDRFGDCTVTNVEQLGCLDRILEVRSV